MSTLSGKVTLITGAASGIGRASAIALAAEGCLLAAADRDAAGLGLLLEGLRDLGARAQGYELDVSQSGEVDAMLARVLEHFGRVDVLVHCAAVAPTCPVLEMTDEAWQNTIATNLHGALYVARATARAMMARGAGTMVFLASDRGLHGGANLAAYAASKGGVIAFMRSLALELAPKGITVNAINPGPTDTPMARAGITEEQWLAKARTDPLGHTSKPEEIAAIVKFLAGTAATFMTGQLITTRVRAM